jgi:hypothetical protein
VKKGGVLLGDWIHWRLAILGYNLWSNSVPHSQQFTIHALSLPSLFSFTSPLIPASNGGRSLLLFLNYLHAIATRTHSTPNSSIFLAQLLTRNFSGAGLEIRLPIPAFFISTD